MVAEGGEPAQVGAVRAGNDLVPLVGARRIGAGDAEIDVGVVGQDPELIVRGVDAIFAPRLARRDQGQLIGRAVGGDEADFAGGVVAGRDEEEALVLAARDADREALVLGFLV